MSYKNLTLTVTDRIARLTLDRPDKMNALSMETLAELQDALKKVALMKDEARVLVITGNGRGFCAGLDLTAPRRNPQDREEALRDFFLPAYRMLKDYPIPTIAAVNGASIGAGMSLALTCDIAVAARSAYFTAAFVNIGLVPDTGASWFVPQSLGSARALGMLMLGEKLPAGKAEEWGLIWKCVDDEKLGAEVDTIATRLANGASKSYDLIKRMVLQNTHSSYHDALNLEAEYQRLVRDSEDALEARKAFAEKRAPVFKGR